MKSDDENKEKHFPFFQRPHLKTPSPSLIRPSKWILIGQGPSHTCFSRITTYAAVGGHWNRWNAKSSPKKTGRCFCCRPQAEMFALTAMLAFSGSTAIQGILVTILLISCIVECYSVMTLMTVKLEVKVTIHPHRFSLCLVHTYLSHQGKPVALIWYCLDIYLYFLEIVTLFLLILLHGWWRAERRRM